MRSTRFHCAFSDARRRFLQTTAGATLSAAGVAVVSGMGMRSALADAGVVDLQKDIRILNTAVAAEHEAVAAYQLGADSGLLTKAVAPTAIAFQSHHKQHV